MLEKKQNVFDDFIAAAEWLIANKYTNPREARDRGRQQRRAARRRRAHAAARALPGRALRVSRPRHGRLPPLQEQQPAGPPRIRRRFEARAVQVPPTPTRPTRSVKPGDEVPGRAAHDRRRRHPRAAAPGAQDDRPAAGRHRLGAGPSCSSTTPTPAMPADGRRARSSTTSRWRWRSSPGSSTWTSAVKAFHPADEQLARAAPGKRACGPLRAPASH